MFGVYIEFDADVNGLIVVGLIKALHKSNCLKDVIDGFLVGLLLAFLGLSREGETYFVEETRFD